MSHDSCTARQSGAAERHPVGPFADVAEVLVRAGLIPLPLTGEDDGKPPKVRGFTSWRRPPAMATVAKWAERWPQANIGIATGRGVVVVDLDSDEPALVEEVNRRFGPTPLVIATPSKGRHLYYRSSGERCANLRPGLPVDIKGAGGYVVAPPSIRPNGEYAGRRYEIVRGSWDDLPRLPVLRRDSLPQHALTEPTRLRAVRPGYRNRILFRSLLQHAPHCDSCEALIDVAHTIVDEQFVIDAQNPFDNSEIEKTARSAWRVEVEGRNWVGRVARIQTHADELEALARHAWGADMILLLLKLRHAHWDREQFAGSPRAMAAAGVIPGWGRSHGRYRRALNALVASGILRIVNQGGTKVGDCPSILLHHQRRGAGARGRRCLSYIGSQIRTLLFAAADRAPDTVVSCVWPLATAGRQCLRI